MPDDLSPSLDDLADPKNGSRLSDYARRSMTHATPQEPPVTPQNARPWQVPGIIGQHLADLALLGPRITQQTLEEGYHGVFPTDEEMADRGMTGAKYAMVGGMPFAPRASMNLLGATLSKIWGPHPIGRNRWSSRFHIIDKDGKDVAYWFLTHHPDGKLKTDYIQTHSGTPLELGTSEMRSLGPELKSEFPTATHIGGTRVTGARYGPASTQTGGIEQPWIPLPKSGNRPPSPDIPFEKQDIHDDIWGPPPPRPDPAQVQRDRMAQTAEWIRTQLREHQPLDDHLHRLQNPNLPTEEE